MLGRLFSHTNKNTTLVADIGSGSAGVAIVTFGQGKARILAAERGVLSFEKRGKDALISGVMQEFKFVASKLMAAYTASENFRTFGHPRFALAVLRAPWSSSETAFLNKKYDHEETITPRLMEDIARVALVQQLGTVRPESVLETGIVRVDINGYPTARPVGKRGSSLSITVLRTTCEPAVRSAVLNGLNEIVPGRRPIIYSSVRALSSALRDRGGLDSEYVVVDITSEGTNFLVTRNDAITASHMVNVGVRTILNGISSSSPAEETLSLIKMVAEGTCSKETCTNVAEMLAGIEPTLLKSFGEGFTALASEHRLPQQLILLCQSEIAPWLAQFFSRLDFSQFTVTSKPFLVEYFSTEQFRNVEVDVGVSADAGLVVAASLAKGV